MTAARHILQTLKTMTSKGHVVPIPLVRTLPMTDKQIIRFNFIQAFGVGACPTEWLTLAEEYRDSAEHCCKHSQHERSYTMLASLSIQMLLKALI